MRKPRKPEANSLSGRSPGTLRKAAAVMATAEAGGWAAERRQHLAGCEGRDCISTLDRALQGDERCWVAGFVDPVLRQAFRAEEAGPGAPPQRGCWSGSSGSATASRKPNERATHPARRYRELPDSGWPHLAGPRD